MSETINQNDPQTKQFVILPNNMCDNPNIGVSEILVYLRLKTHLNSKTKECFPSYETLSKECECGKNQVIKYIQHLVDEGYVKIEKRPGRRSNFYSFPEPENDKYQMIPYRLLNHQNLTSREKARLAILQQYFIIDKDNRTGEVSISELEISNLLKVSTSTVYKDDRSLISKEVISKFKSNVKDKVSGVYNNTRLTYLEKTHQADTLLAEDLQNTKEIMLHMIEAMNALGMGQQEMKEHILELEKRVDSQDKTLPKEFPM